MHYYQHHIGDYRRDTAHLSLLEHGVYRQLLDWAYLDNDPIPKETETVYRRLSARTDEEKNAVNIVLSEFFTLEIGYTQKRAEIEKQAYERKAATARIAGKLGGRPKKTEEVISGLTELTDSKANHEPLTINHKPKEEGERAKALARPDDVDLQVWTDWVQLRKAKKAPITETVLKTARKEAALAGMPLMAFLEIWCARGSQGLEAAWLRTDDKPGVSRFPDKNAPMPVSSIWHESAAGVRAKAAQIGVREGDLEQFPIFKARVMAAAQTGVAA